MYVLINKSTNSFLKYRNILTDLIKTSGGQITEEVLSHCSQMLGFKDTLVKMYDKEVQFHIIRQNIMKTSLLSDNKITFSHKM